MNHDPRHPVTVRAVWRARPGHEAGFEQAVHDVIAAASAFPGHLGVDVYRHPTARPPQLHLVFRYDSRASLARWERSAERRAAYAAANRHADGPLHWRRLTGLEAWFDLPTAGPPPPRWKMFLLTWAAAFLVAAGVYAVLGTTLAQLPLLARAAVMTAILVGCLTFAVMPALTRLCHDWLIPTGQTTPLAPRPAPPATADPSSPHSAGTTGSTPSSDHSPVGRPALGERLGSGRVAGPSSTSPSTPNRDP